MVTHSPSNAAFTSRAASVLDAQIASDKLQYEQQQ